MIFYLFMTLCAVTAQMCPSLSELPKHGILRFQLPNEGTPLPKPVSSVNPFRSVPAPFHPLNMKLSVVGSDVPFQMSTEADRERIQVLKDLDRFLKASLPILFGESVDCGALSESECVGQEGCSWCDWPDKACQFTDVSYLLPTEERCVDGGEPYDSDILPVCIMNADINSLQWVSCYE